MNYSKLRGRIVEKYGTLGKFADKINRNRSIVSQVLNGYMNLTTENILIWANALEISPYEIGEYFFVQKVDDCKQEK